jgi:hypothetical protein
MGFFSWKCALTGKSIPAYPDAGRSLASSTVLMVLPDNTHVAGVYDGYGNIGDKDVYDLVAPFYFDDKHATRAHIFNNNKYITTPDGEEVTIQQLNWAEPLQRFDGMTLNDLVQAGHTVEQDFYRLQDKGFIKIVRQDAYGGESYDELPASERCPDQGYFYSYGDEEDEG